MLDAAAPGLAAGIAVGRFGDLAIGDHIGAPAPDSPLAWRCAGNLWERASNSFGYVAPQTYPASGTPVQGCFDVPVIQTAMLDVLAAGLTLAILLLLERRIERHGTGLLAASFIVAYGSGRLVFDFLRADLRYAGLTASQWVALTAIGAAGTWIAVRRPWREAAPQDAIGGDTQAPGGP